MEEFGPDEQGMLHIGTAFLLPITAVDFTYCRASGPGGQYVNRTDSAVQLRLPVTGSPLIPEEVQARLQELAGGQLTNEGILLIECQEFRSQARNRETALRRLVTLLLAASRKKKVRRPTAPTRASRERRLQTKKRHSQIKSNRRGKWE
ncbi:MAG: aminoacyl-tRNA hydrolase [Victivallales bacterium]|nr:aminoacyl-tRNA hydrolase [Victivallales bacterium]